MKNSKKQEKIFGKRPHFLHSSDITKINRAALWLAENVTL